MGRGNSSKYDNCFTVGTRFGGVVVRLGGSDVCGVPHAVVLQVFRLRMSGWCLFCFLFLPISRLQSVVVVPSSPDLLLTRLTTAKNFLSFLQGFWNSYIHILET